MTFHELNLARLMLIKPALETVLVKQPTRRPRQGGLLVDKAILATRLTPRSWVKLPLIQPGFASENYSLQS